MYRISIHRLLFALIMVCSANLAAQEGQEGAETEAQAAAVSEALERARAEEQEALAAVERARADLQKVQQEKQLQNVEEARAVAEVRAAERAELAAMREELSRVHENLRRASREVARVHREIDRTQARSFVTSGEFVNIGDKAIIGVILGESVENGVPVLGVSPDGPAERAGIEQGDIIISMMDKPLADKSGSDARRVLSQVMDGVKVGDELLIGVKRGEENLEFKVTADKREPVAWQSIVRLPSAPAAPGAPGAPPAHSIERHIRIPEVATAELQEKLERIKSELGNIEIIVDGEGAIPFGDGMAETWEYRFENLSDLGGDVISETNVWFGLPATRGLKFAEVNEDLGKYFNVKEGVLVLSAREGNDLQLNAGDVLLKVGDRSVNKPGDVVRALRDWEPGSSIELEIKRDRRDRKLDVVLPERTVGFNFAPGVEDHRIHVIGESEDL